MKALVVAFNQVKALVGAFSVIVQPVVEPMDRFAALNQSLSSPSPTQSSGHPEHGRQQQHSLCSQAQHSESVSYYRVPLQQLPGNSGTLVTGRYDMTTKELETKVIRRFPKIS